MTRQYKVTVLHPTNYHSGDHILTLHTNTDGTRYVDGSAFGCSRDYHVKSNVDAIKLFLAEHACTAIKIRNVRG